MMAERARENSSRRSVRTIPSWLRRKRYPRQIVAGLDAWRDMAETFSKRMFLSVYGSPVLQAAVGIDAAGARNRREGRRRDRCIVSCCNPGSTI